ncbi:MAG: Multi antimicrobial extrusion protein [Acidobacteria bacterium]|nr:Multi antimicrobial extrusion protein [Acidobacteriota bacterium]
MDRPLFRSELRQLCKLAVPLTAAQAGNQLMGVVDVAVVGRLGAMEVAATGLAHAIYFSMAIVGMGIIYGVDPIISQAVGAGDPIRARRMFWQGVWLSLLVTGVLSIALLAVPHFLPLTGVKQELWAPTASVLVVRTFGLAPFLLFLVARAYLQAHGITRPMLTSMIVSNIFNFVTDLYFVFGGTILPLWCGPLRKMPALGVTGAALSTTLGTFLQLAIVLGAVNRLKLPPHEHAPVHLWEWPKVRHALRVGFPVGLQMGAEIGVFAFVGLLAGRLGTLDLAAHQLVLTLASFTYTVALGVSSAGSVRVGLAVGARNQAATRAAGYATLALGAAVGLFNASLFALFPQPLARIITDQQAVIAASVPLFLVAAVFQLSDGIQGVGAGVLRGAGDTRFSLAANLLGHWLIGLPIALYLGFYRHMGVVGLWWGLCAGLTVVAILLFHRFEKLSANEIAPMLHS